MTLLNINITKAQFKIASKVGITGGSVFANDINMHIAHLNHISDTTTFKSYPAICKTLINKLNVLKVEAAKADKAQTEAAKAQAEIKAQNKAKAKAQLEENLSKVADEAKAQGVPAYFLLLMPKPHAA